MLKCGEDDEGYSVKIKLKYFLQYMHTQVDDSPLYIFDCAFDEHAVANALLLDYDIPKYYRDDLFKLVGERRRPPYRWFLIGPERSGSSLHIDPLATSAWNTLISGVKQWVIFKPGASKRLCKGSELRQAGEDSEAITWFTKVLPRIRQRERNHDNGLGMCEFLQYPGETVFIPGGWWHAVLNLTDTVACTQNFCSQNNFPKVWRKTRKGRKHMAKQWLDRLGEHYPHLAAQARTINDQDGFEFKFSSKHKHKKKKSHKDKDKSRDRQGERDSENGKHCQRECNAQNGYSYDRQTSPRKKDSHKHSRKHSLKHSRYDDQDRHSDSSHSGHKNRRRDHVNGYDVGHKARKLHKSSY